jgi:hypothetical protein
VPSLLCVIGLLGANDAYAQQRIGGCAVLPPDNIWNTPIDQLPVLTNSSSMVTTIGAGTGVHADFGSGTWDGGPIGIPFVTVGGTQTKVPATFLYADESDRGPYAVPLTAPIEGGSNATGDRHAIAIDTTNCILYELYNAWPQAASWNADSGAIFDLTSNALRPSSWTSGDAAGLPILPGLVTYDEVLSGEITHAIRFTAPRTRREFVWPARHYASSLTGSQYPRMGERFRLKASFDISPFPADVQVILRAMKKVRNHARRQRVGVVHLGSAGRALEQRPPAHAWTAAGVELRGRRCDAAAHRSNSGAGDPERRDRRGQPAVSFCPDRPFEDLHRDGSRRAQHRSPGV